jgi:hypothetical protein
MGNSKPACVILPGIYGHCHSCFQRVKPAHLIELRLLEEFRLYCPDCCQECRRKRLREAGGADPPLGGATQGKGPSGAS